MKTQITLSPEELEYAIQEFLSKKFKRVGKVRFNVKQELRGHYTNEHYEAVFKGVTCEVEM